MDETIDINRQGVKQVHNLTLALMTDPGIYHRQSDTFGYLVTRR